MRLTKKNKDGFSLIELVIVIVIMAVLTGLTALGIGFMKAGDTRGVASEIDSCLSELKSQAMAKNKPVYMHLYQYDGNYYVKYTETDSTTPNSDGEEIGSGEVSVVTSDGVDVSGSHVVTFAIRKKDGAFTMGPEKITVSSDYSKTYTVCLVKDTGKHFVE